MQMPPVKKNDPGPDRRPGRRCPERAVHEVPTQSRCQFPIWFVSLGCMSIVPGRWRTYLGRYSITGMAWEGLWTDGGTNRSGGPVQGEGRGAVARLPGGGFGSLR